MKKRRARVGIIKWISKYGVTEGYVVLKFRRAKRKVVERREDKQEKRREVKRGEERRSVELLEKIR